MRDGINRAVHVVEQLLTLARADPAAGEAAREPVDLMELAQSVHHAHEAEAAARGCAFALELRDAPLVVDGNLVSLRTMLDNLVDNSIRHGGAQAIALRAQRGAAGEAVLVVEDAGRGIPAAERERVFDRFYRAEGASEGGTGLGLAIVRRIAQAHGGRVELADGAGGKGLRARVVLPIA